MALVLSVSDWQGQTDGRMDGQGGLVPDTQVMGWWLAGGGLMKSYGPPSPPPTGAPRPRPYAGPGASPMPPMERHSFALILALLKLPMLPREKN